MSRLNPSLFGRGVRCLRLRGKITQTKLAKAVGISQPTVSRIETGLLSHIDDSYYGRIIDALDRLIGREPTLFVLPPHQNRLHRLTANRAICNRSFQVRILVEDQSARERESFP